MSITLTATSMLLAGLQAATLAGAVHQRGRQTLGIINGSVVIHPLEKYSFFALPTSSAETDTWLGCGASIISPTFAISAAHCFGGGNDPCSRPRTLAVWVGDVTVNADFVVSARPGAKHFRTEAELICNPSFDGVCAHGHDVALLKLKTPVPSWVRPVVLDLSGSSPMTAGSPVISIGFGLTESEGNKEVIGDISPQLREVTLSVLDDSSDGCKNEYAGGYGCSDEHSEDKASNIDQQLCAGATDLPERDTCSGDSGSPMLDTRTGKQVGIVSYGGGPGAKVTGPGRECGDASYPGIYSRVAAFAEFLSATVPDLPTQVTEVIT